MSACVEEQETEDEIDHHRRQRRLATGRREAPEGKKNKAYERKHDTVSCDKDRAFFESVFS